MSNLLPGTRERVLVPFGMPPGGEPNYRRGDSRFQSGVEQRQKETSHWRPPPRKGDLGSSYGAVPGRDEEFQLYDAVRGAPPALDEVSRGEARKGMQRVPRTWMIILSVGCHRLTSPHIASRVTTEPSYIVRTYMGRDRAPSGPHNMLGGRMTLADGVAGCTGWATTCRPGPAHWSGGHREVCTEAGEAIVIGGMAAARHGPAVANRRFSGTWTSLRPARDDRPPVCGVCYRDMAGWLRSGAVQVQVMGTQVRARCV